jgi:hypothetical protein
LKLLKQAKISNITPLRYQVIIIQHREMSKRKKYNLKGMGSLSCCLLNYLYHNLRDHRPVESSRKRISEMLIFYDILKIKLFLQIQNKELKFGMESKFGMNIFLRSKFWFFTLQFVNDIKIYLIVFERLGKLE